MTVATLRYNSSTGTDTGASGSNAPETPITGSNADVSGTVVTLNETVDFTGVADDDSDIIWIDTPAGERHLFRIVSFSPSVAAATSVSVLESATTPRTGDSWAVGGKRQSFDNDTSNPDLDDFRPGWEAELDEAIDYALSSSAIPYTIASASGANGGVVIKARSGHFPKVTWDSGPATDVFNLAANAALRLEGIEFENTTGLGTDANFVYCSVGSTSVAIVDCSVIAPGRCVHADATNINIVLSNSYFQSLYSSGIEFSQRGALYMVGSEVALCTADGIHISYNSSLFSLHIISSLIRNNDGVGVYVPAIGTNGIVVVQNNTIHQNGGDGIECWGNAAVGSRPMVITNNLITEHGSGSAINFSGTQGEGFNDTRSYVDYNSFRGNSSNNTGIADGEHDVVLTADPYTDESGNDYSLNNAAGGGALIKNKAVGRHD